MTRDLDGSELPLGVGSLGEVNLQGAAAERREPGGPHSEPGGRVSVPLGQPKGLPPKIPHPPPRLGAWPGAAHGWRTFWQAFEHLSCMGTPSFLVLVRGPLRLNSAPCPPV